MSSYHKSCFLIGIPNSGKTSLFNELTGKRGSVGNYSGVTVKEEHAWIPLFPDQKLALELIDLPGIYSLNPFTPDENVTVSFLHSHHPTFFLFVADASRLDKSLSLLLEIQQFQKPILLFITKKDLLESSGWTLDESILKNILFLPFLRQKNSIQEQVKELKIFLDDMDSQKFSFTPALSYQRSSSSSEDTKNRYSHVDYILQQCFIEKSQKNLWPERLDSILLHPLLGCIFLIFIIILIFQFLFTWAIIPMDYIKNLVTFLSESLYVMLPEGALRSLLIDGILSGVGTVIVFLPQILLLFFFLNILEESGYLPRAAFLLDGLMIRFGLSGRSFFPLLLSFACAIPGILSTRTISHRFDRLITILIAPFMTCSARLPVYALLITAFIPPKHIWGPFSLQGMVLLGLFLLGICVSFFMSLFLRNVFFPHHLSSPLLLELPPYQFPKIKEILISLYDRAFLFLYRAGTWILCLSIILWFFSYYPEPPVDSPHPRIFSSYIGQLSQWLEPFFAPLGFNWKIIIALFPSFIAREIMIGALATVYSLSSNHSGNITDLIHTLQTEWSLATALSLLVWYALACQCGSTLAVTQKETQSWIWPCVMFIYMNALAYLCSWITYRLVIFFT